MALFADSLDVTCRPTRSSALSALSVNDLGLYSLRYHSEFHKIVKASGLLELRPRITGIFHIPCGNYYIFYSAVGFWLCVCKIVFYDIRMEENRGVQHFQGTWHYKVLFIVSLVECTLAYY